MKSIYLILLTIIIGCNQSYNENSILKFQNNLIESERTGSNVAMVFKNNKIVYNEIVNSGKEGDKEINSQTIFPIWSMSKPVTTVAMMILYDQGEFELNDNLSDYLPEYKNMMCQNEDLIEPCQNQIKIIDF